MFAAKFGPVAEWLGKALQKLLQRFESARDLYKPTRLTFCRFFNFYNMKYSQQIGILASILVIATCFLPWIEIPVLHQTLNGVNGKVNDNITFGKQINMHAFLSCLAILFFALSFIWAKRFNIFICFLNISWAIKNFILFSLCRPECPIIKPGLYLLVFFSSVMLIMSFLPKIKIQTK